MSDWRILMIGAMSFLLAILCVLLFETLMEPESPQVLPELDEVTRWRLHREARKILDDSGAGDAA